MPRSASAVSVPKRLSFELEDALPRGVTSPRAFRADLKALDPVLSASLPDWPLEDVTKDGSSSFVKINSPSVQSSDDDGTKSKPSKEKSFVKRNFTLLHNHKGLLVRSSGKGTVLIGGGGDTVEKNTTVQEKSLSSPVGSTKANEEWNFSSSNAPTQATEELHESSEHLLHHSFKTTPSASKDPTQKGGIEFGIGQCFGCEILPTTTTTTTTFSPNELFFGGGDSGPDRCSGLSYKDREERVRQMRERQQLERQQKLEELKEQAAAAQRFREQQEALRRQRLDEMRSKDSERRNQVEERKRLIQQAEQERREAVLRKSAEREHRLDLKRRHERSNVVFAFGSSTPRMLDPKENLQNYFGGRRATSTTNVNISDSSSSVRRTSEVQDVADLSRKRATSAHSLNRKLDDDEGEAEKETLHAKPSRVADFRMSTSMYEVFNWDDSEDTSPTKTPFYQSGQGDETQRHFVPPPSTAARRRTDLLPAFPSLRDANIGSSTTRSSPRHRSPGVRSGTATPGASSRPTSALSQASGGSSQVVLRSRTSPRKPRPLSIAGTTISSADKPRGTSITATPSAVASVASPNRESRSIDRKSTTAAAPTPSRAKSAGSDVSAPSTPSKTPRGSTPKRTPAQVKAENAAKKAAERSKGSQKPKSTPKTTPLQSPSVEFKPLPSFEKKIMKGETKINAAGDAECSQVSSEQDTNTEICVTVDTEEIVTQQETATFVDAPKTIMDEINTPSDVLQPQSTDQINDHDLKPSEVEEDNSQTLSQRAIDKPVTGYASEEEYKAALAEKRRQAREAKEKEEELERQRKLEEEERERKEEEEYLRLMEEQRKAEEERLHKAIEEAERLREAEAIKREEEEKQRIEAEKIEHQKKLEAEEKMKKEEEERQMRKSRVAAIMSRTRGKGSASANSKADAKSSLEEGKGLNDSIMSSSMTESLLNNLSSSMTDSMIVQAIESHQTSKSTSEVSQILENEQQQEQDMLSHSTQSGQPLTNLSSQAFSDKSSQSRTSMEVTLISDIDTKSEESQYQPETITVTKTTVTSTESTESVVEPKSLMLSTHINGTTPAVPMETSPTSQVVTLLGSFNGVNGVNQNGVHSGDFQSSERHDNQFGSLDPLNSTTQTILATDAIGESFDQIIDLNQVKLTNEDAINSNPPQPIIAFEENLNRKSQQQSQDTSTNVPDLLL